MGKTRRFNRDLLRQVDQAYEDGGLDAASRVWEGAPRLRHPHWTFAVGICESKLFGWGCSRPAGARRDVLTPNLAREYERTAQAVREWEFGLLEDDTEVDDTVWCWCGDEAASGDDECEYHLIIQWEAEQEHYDRNWSFWYDEDDSVLAWWEHWNYEMEQRLVEAAHRLRDWNVTPDKFAAAMEAAAELAEREMEKTA